MQGGLGGKVRTKKETLELIDKLEALAVPYLAELRKLREEIDPQGTAKAEKEAREEAVQMLVQLQMPEREAKRAVGMVPQGMTSAQEIIQEVFKRTR